MGVHGGFMGAPGSSYGFMKGSWELLGAHGGSWKFMGTLGGFMEAYREEKPGSGLCKENPKLLLLTSCFSNPSKETEH